MKHFLEKVFRKSY